MDAIDLFERRKEIDNNLTNAVKLFKERGRAYAKAEHDYRVALAKKLYQLKEDGYPATTSSDLARGDELVAQLKFGRDEAEVLYKSLLEAINVFKIQLRVIESDIEAERRGS